MSLLLVAGGYVVLARAGLGSAGAASAAQPDAAPAPAEAPDRAASDSSVVYPRPGPGLNLLALEASPYLRLHAHNPVDWYPWGEQAFARARAEDKIVFLSVGYSTCYWCHVMERETFSNPEIAAFMNAHFVSIKVDREERPDLDDIYMKATHLLTGRGGWPNSLFLTPESKPFFAGTYFPPADRRGRPGFPRVLRSLHAAWSNEREGVLATAEQVTQRLEEIASPGATPQRQPPPASEVMGRAIEKLRSAFDREYGGFGRGTKFPRAPTLDLLLTRLEQERSPEVDEMLVRTLDAMALGGIYDHLGDGFHRYSTERTWSIPHFEKMLYDNAQLVSIYARAYTLTQRPLYRRVVERTLAFLDREMSHAEGGFVSAQDAEVAGEEGASYVWSRGEIESVLGPEQAKAFFAVYQLAPLPEHSNFGVLRVQLPAPDTSVPLARFDDARALLLAKRAKRPQPLRDDKVLAAWNGLAIRGLVDAAAALDRPDYLRRAERAAQFVLARLRREDGTLRRSYIAGQAREQGVLDDYAFLADGLLALHRSTGSARWLEAARGLTDVLLASFEDATGGGFFLTPEGTDLLIRPKPYEDNALPSGNSAALRVLRILAAELGSERYAQAAAGTAASATALLVRAPQALPATVAVLASAATPAVATQPVTPSDESEAFALPRSEDHVHARLVRSVGSDPPALSVQLSVDEGWHVNANPASFDFLVPTSVERVDSGPALSVRYPPGRSFRPAFADSSIQVYEGKVEIAVVSEPTAQVPHQLAIHYQACDVSRCLPPHRALLQLDPPAEASP